MRSYGAEKRSVLQMAIQVSNGRVPVLSGVAENSTAAACRYARDCEKLGADGVSTTARGVGGAATPGGYVTSDGAGGR